MAKQVFYKHDYEKQVIVTNFERRGWQKASNEEDWNIYWANAQTARAIFNPENAVRLRDDQLINHFPNHYELTRKDLMVKNIKRYKRDREKAALADPEVEVLFDYVPTTYSLPSDYALFVEEFRRTPSTTWIMKPAQKAQGKGIFLVSRLTQLKKWANNDKNQHPFGGIPLREPYIISRYLDRPVLIGGKKFDLRFYVLVTSYRPLKIWMYGDGYTFLFLSFFSLQFR